MIRYCIWAISRIWTRVLDPASCAVISYAIGIKEVSSSSALNPSYTWLLIFGMDKAKPENKATLIGVLFHCLYTPFLSITFPRFFLAIYRCSQPLLIHEIITFIEQSRKNSHQKCDKFWILVAAITVYLGLAVSIISDNLSQGTSTANKLDFCLFVQTSPEPTAADVTGVSHRSYLQQDT